MVGDNRGAKSNPEVIAPLDKLKKYMGEGSGGNIQGVFKISGRDLVAVINQENKFINTLT